MDEKMIAETIASAAAARMMMTTTKSTRSMLCM